MDGLRRAVDPASGGYRIGAIASRLTGRVADLSAATRPECAP
ncbi:hypothetical protein I547_2934 [Mycobacterium kansasii 824]|uniref:Uncharacterized protein n=1 Tax=Mycobacterium kansasii TaxID=1768 RepID=A0A1V3XA92_MYCKA|nr:hypothetical protein I547_2934 [Mycobacterium kansasii 824]OOK73182.1 hypothetical protein BZL29_5253 [Mycobacterium kansasii]OOK75686.1 hypothetical protein BZL30_3645 [Mycobacterium kansasii]